MAEYSRLYRDVLLRPHDEAVRLIKPFIYAGFSVVNSLKKVEFRPKLDHLTINSKRKTTFGLPFLHLVSLDVEINPRFYRGKKSERSYNKNG